MSRLFLLLLFSFLSCQFQEVCEPTECSVIMYRFGSCHPSNEVERWSFERVETLDTSFIVWVRPDTTFLPEVDNSCLAERKMEDIEGMYLEERKMLLGQCDNKGVAVLDRWHTSLVCLDPT